ncbi:type III secretion system inner membrane ring subunit SctD [Mesorhizobium sp. M0016]|uniref:type III secretion system inner membrane ring subunit SctD n=1 Tax=Mesorhizobium sp. M0016 TaxID=2956843 RepID=UPI00333D2B6C
MSEPDVESVTVTGTGDDAQLVLRVLSGPNRNAETSLEEGVWSIGASDTDDLTFADPGLAAAHLRISVEQGRIHIIALAPGVRIGAKDLPIDHWTVLEPLTPVQVGRTIFAIGPTRSSFPEIDPVVRSREPDGPAHRSSRPELASALGGRQIHLMGGSATRRWRLGAVACALLIAPAVGVWTAIGPVPPSALEAAADADPMRAEPDIVRESNLVNIIPVGDKPVIAGDLRHGDDAKLKAALSNADVEAEVLRKQPTTMSDSQLIDLVTTVIRGFGIEGGVRVIGAGHITITGYGPSDAKVEAAFHRLREDIPGLGEVENAIVTPECARAFLETAMTAQLRRSTHILAKADGVLVSGALTAIAFEAWEHVASRFQQKFAPYIQLETQFTPVLLPALRGVHLGRTPFIVVENGTRFKVGDSLETLGRIVAIDRAGVFVRLGTDEVHVPYQSTPSWIAEEKG